MAKSGALWPAAHWTLCTALLLLLWKTTELAQVVSPTISIQNHRKAVVVAGDTFPVKDILKRLGGKFNKKLRGWVFPGSWTDQLLEDLAVEIPESVTIKNNLESVGHRSSDSAAQPVSIKSHYEHSVDIILGDTADERVIASVSAFNDNPRVDIRRYRHTAMGELKPMRKGVPLWPEQWHALTSKGPDVDAELNTPSYSRTSLASFPIEVTDTLFVHILGSKENIQVDVRHFYTNDNGSILAREAAGVTLSLEEWYSLTDKETTNKINSALARLQQPMNEVA